MHYFAWYTAQMLQQDTSRHYLGTAARRRNAQWYAWLRSVAIGVMRGLYKDTAGFCRVGHEMQCCVWYTIQMPHQDI